jgi:hypothetical protein
MRAGQHDAINDAPTGQPALARQCDDCERTLLAAEIERKTRELALRGVPLA